MGRTDSRGGGRQLLCVVGLLLGGLPGPLGAASGAPLLEIPQGGAPSRLSAQQARGELVPPTNRPVRPAAFGLPFLVKDVNSGVENPGSNPQAPLAVGGVVCFTADDGVVGRELWKSDGTTAGTVRVRPGGVPFEVAGLTDVGGTLFFVGNDGSSGLELWKSDGTADGTVLVKDIRPGGGSSSPSGLTVVGTTLFFRADNGVHGAELWKSDGTPEGTVLVTDLVAGVTSSSPSGLTALGGLVFFSATDPASGAELWKSDGTAGGTTRVRDIVPGTASSSPAQFIGVGGVLYFTASDPSNGRELWRSDGSEGGTVLVRDVRSGAASSNPAGLIDLGGSLLFFADDGTSGNELWKSDGTPGGTVLVKDINPGSLGTYPQSRAVAGGSFFFSATDPTNGDELWMSDGTTGGTVPVVPLSPFSSPRDLREVSGRLFFSADDPSGNELWMTDGTPAGTAFVANIAPGSASSYPVPLAAIGSTLLLAAHDGTVGTELWKSDGTGGGTVLVRDIRGSSGISSSPSNLTPLASAILFGGNAGSTGEELWRSDGTGVGTVLVRDINPGAVSSGLTGFTEFGGQLFFAANDGVHDTELWQTDGTVGGTLLSADVCAPTSPDPEAPPPPYCSGEPRELTAVGGNLLFTATDDHQAFFPYYTGGVTGREIYRRDLLGSFGLVKDILPMSPMSPDYPTELTSVDGSLFFRANDGASGHELWSSDGTEFGTVLVSDIVPGVNGAYPGSLTAVGTRLFFTAWDSSFSFQSLWTSDGTAPGTVPIVPPVSPNTFAEMTDVGGTLFFMSASGTELWKSDGTNGGTVLVKDIHPGSASASPSHLTNVGGSLIFAADDGTGGRELWKSDGTPAGTVLVADIFPGPGSSSPANITPIGGNRFLFSANDGIHGVEVWGSDGTAAGTALVGDLATGPASSNPSGFTLAGPLVYFRANDRVVGEELWAVDTEVHDVTPPVALVQQPDGGEVWIEGSAHQIFWKASDDVQLQEIRLYYCTNFTDNGIDDESWVLIDTLPFDRTNYLWSVPHTLSATCRVKVVAVDTSGNEGADVSNGNFYIIQYTTTGIRTLIAWSPDRFEATYGASSRALVAGKIGELAAHDKVAGVILDVLSVPAVQDAYTCWDDCYDGNGCGSAPPCGSADPDRQARANAVAEAIRDWLLAQANLVYTSTQSLILVGDDRQIPFHRMADGTAIYPESRYPSEVDLQASTTIGSAIADGRFLSDTPYAEFLPERSPMPPPHHQVYPGDLALGRLVETPSDIEGVINAFLSRNGQVNLLTANQDVLVTGFDFLWDSAGEIRDAWAGRPEPTDCLLDDPERTGLTDPCDNFEYGPADLGNAVFVDPPHQVTNVNTHATHFEWATGTGRLTTTEMQADPDDLEGTILYTSGCHSGLSVPPTDSHPLDLPETLARKRVLANIGNTGYGWGLRHGSGLTEELMRLLTAELTSNDSITIGRALANAKRAYHLRDMRWDVFDDKVLHELTLFGIPNTLVVGKVAGIAPGREEELPPPGDLVGRVCAREVCVERIEGARATVDLPPGMTELALGFQFGAGAYSSVTTPDGKYWRLNGQSSDEVGSPLQPRFVYNSQLSGTVPHGAMFTGGHYLEESPFDPVISVPRSTNPDRGEGNIPPIRMFMPGMNFSYGVASSRAPKGFETSAIGQMGFANLVVQTGYYDETGTPTESRFDAMQFVAFYSNSGDTTPPVVTDPGAVGFHTLTGLEARFRATVSDSSGLHRVLVTWQEARTQSWKSLELSRDEATGEWRGSLLLKGSILYYVQAVDVAGNVGMVSRSGSDLDGDGNPYGSGWSGPKYWPIDLVDTDLDGLPDPFETQHPCLDPLAADAGSDGDWDYLTSAEEFELDTNPCLGDSDRGGDNDGSEAHHGRSALVGQDDRRLSIQVTQDGPEVTVSWPSGLGENGSIDGRYFVYRSSTPFFGPGNLISPPGPSPAPIADGTTSWIDSLPPCDPCFYKVWNSPLLTPPPTLASVVPASGPAGVATAVDLYGQGFASGAAVTFCGVPATDVTVHNPSWISCRTPASIVPGGCDVRVTNPNGQDGLKSGGFEFQ